MNRRDFLKCVMTGAGTYSFSGFPQQVRATINDQSIQKILPNIIIIYADDMGYGDIACQNPESKIPTPNLDRLAREGVRFTDAHSSSGICTPSRYALLTGRYHWRDFHDIVDSFEGSKFKAGQLTLPKMLKTKGYRTACIGKWHLGWDWSMLRNETIGDRNSPDAWDWSKPVPGGPIDHGFDYYFGDDVPNFPPYTWIENDRIMIPPSAPLEVNPIPAEGRHECRPGPMAEGWRLDKVMPRLTEKTVEWIKDQKADVPFFLFWSWTSPHTPIVPAEKFQGTTNAGPYGDFVYQSDAHAGEVLQALEDRGLADNTLIIFTSDNGPERYAFERVQKYDHRSMGPLRGLKRDIWEGGHRVPFVVRWPGVIQPGRISDALISQIDLMATFASIVGYELSDIAAEDSYNLLDVWLDNSDKTTSRNVHIHNTFETYAIRKGNWVLIDAPSGSITRMPDWFIEANDYDVDMPEGGLYNLREDIGQRKNRIDEYPEKVIELRKLLQNIRDKGYSAPRFKAQ